MKHDGATEATSEQPSAPAGDTTDASSMRADDRGAPPEGCPVPAVTHTQELIDNIPYLVMILLGAAMCWVALDGGVRGALTAGLYAVYGVAGALWIMLFVCPYCHFYDTRLCPCGYGKIASKLRPRKDGDRFATQFRKHIPVIVPLWFLPLVAAGIGLYRGFTWLLLGLVLVFAVNSFVILPLVSRMYGCADCTQKDTCPWMGGCKGT